MLRLKEFAEKIKAAKDQNQQKYIAHTEINTIRISFENQQVTFRVRNVAKLIFLDFLGYKHGLGKKQCKQLISCRYLIEKKIGYIGFSQIFKEQNLELVELINLELTSGNKKRMLLALIAIASLYFPKSNIDSHLITAYSYLEQGLCRALSQQDLQIKKKAIFVCCQAISYNEKISKLTGTMQKALMLQQVKSGNIDTIFWLTNSFCLMIDQENLPANFFETFSLSIASFNKIAMHIQMNHIFRYQMIKSKQYIILKKMLQKYKNTGKQVGKLIKQVCVHSYKTFITLLSNGQFTQRLIEFCTLQRYFEVLILYLKDSELIYESIKNILSPLVSTKNFLTYYHCIQALNSIKLLLDYSYINQKQTELVEFTVRSLANISQDVRFCAVSCFFSFIYPNCKPPNQYIILQSLCKKLEQAKMKPKLRYLILIQFLFIYMERKNKPLIDYAFNRLMSVKNLQLLSVVNLIMPGKLQDFDNMIIRTIAHLIQIWNAIKKQLINQKISQKSAIKSAPTNHNVSQSYLNFQKANDFDYESFDFELSQLLVSLISQRSDLDEETILYIIPNIAKLGNNEHVQQILTNFTRIKNEKIQKKTYITLEQLKKNQFFDSRCLKSKFDESNLSKQQLLKKAQPYYEPQQYKILSESMRKDSEEWENLNLNKSQQDDEIQYLNKQQIVDKEAYTRRKGPVIPVKPIKISIFLRSTGYNVIQLGTHRILEVLFYSGKDDRSKDDYKTVTERAIKWQTDPQGIIEVDMYGRLNTLKAGNVQLKVTSLANTDAYDVKRITVVQKSNSKFTKVKKLKVDYKGSPIPQYSNLQKIVKRFTNAQIQSNQSIPMKVKMLLFNKQAPKLRVIQGQIQWKIVSFADGSSGKYVIRTDSSLPTNHRDRIQYFMGNRYLPGDGKSPKSIDDDGSNGVWVIGMNGDITHIAMQKINYKQKAQKMSLDTQKNVLRHGFASGSDWNGFQWVSGPSDNDGLWTALYGSGQLMRYATLKNYNFPSKDVAEARKSALRSLKAVVFLGNVSGRDGICKSTIRVFPNVVIGRGEVYTKQYLKKDKVYAVDNYVGSPYDSIGFFGLDAGKTTDGHYIGGKFKYSLQGLYDEDWTQTQEPALTEKTLKGYLSRTFCITPLQKTTGGLCFQRNEDGTQTVVSGADQLIDYGPNDHPTLNVGNLPIPDVLKDVLYQKGVQYDIKDINYKGDLSYDQVIGHLFIYKIGFDIMDQKDKQEKQLKQLIKQTVINYAQHLLDNGYTVCDATGLATRWGKVIRDFLNSDFFIQEGNMHGVILLMTFKLAYYMTNDHKWQDEYVFLCEHENIRLLDYCTVYWKRNLYLNLNDDNSPQRNVRHLDQKRNPSEAQMLAHGIYCTHFSDQQMAMMVYYMTFQLQTDPKYLQKYQQGLDGWWHSISRSQNPLWYYIYQLSKPTELIKDAFGNNILDTAAWQLSRHPIDTIRWVAYFDGSRPDVLRDFRYSVDPKVIIGKRTSQTDTQNANFAFNFKILPQYDPKNIHQIKVVAHDQRSIHKFNGTTFDAIGEGNPNVMEPATTYTLPYWLGVYHKMLEFKYQ